MVKRISLLLLTLLLVCKIGAQTCTTLGQTPSTAFPVCGTLDFSQSSVPICSTNPVYVPGCSGTSNALYEDKNPFWYKFTCYQTGTLGFLITPNDLGDDYDWQLFDVTGHDPNDVFINSKLFVSGNWSGSYGLTGASSSGVGNIQCGSDPAANVPRFSMMPTIIKGHNYILLISHFTDSQSGYKLSFGGGSASITDTTRPRLKSASISCDATKITVIANKKVQCNSVVTTGNPNDFDFTLSTGVSHIIAATGFNCSNSFDMDTVILTLSNPLPVGSYVVTMQNGKDGNTLLDNCGTSIPQGDQVGVDVLPQQPTPMDSIQPVGCSPNSLQLVFKKNINCSSIAADGSDFLVTGPGNVVIGSASGICNSDNLSPVININLNAPIVKGGVYHITLKSGSDGNTIIDECGQQTPAGASLDFIAVDTVSADFTYQVLLGCNYDTINFNHVGGNGINLWNWTFDGANNSSQQNPQVIYSVYGDKNVQLIVSNGVCSDTVTKIVSLDNELKAAFETTNILCPEDLATFKNNSIGNIVSFDWNLGDGSADDFQPTPADHRYVAPNVEKIYTAKLIVRNNLGCYDTAVQQIRKLRSCYIAVPNAFTPNGDGINDYLYPLNAYKAGNLIFRVYNRYGQLVFETTDWTRKWDGTIRGVEQGTGTYVWTLQYTEKDSGKKFSLKGTSTLIR
ncbi:MAG: gliding motility-associated C-terminal domain-containing protein [Bacteroidetes bacterium]|nr:gliding motility-associated C-terminal domain-containing protein [Bacteroidota bacterium]